MTEDNNKTGYPSLDKPWLKYYSENAMDKPLPNCTMYEYLVECNRDHLDDIALIYFDKKITYKNLILQIDRAASALMASGIKQGAVVSIMSLNTPETIALFYALNKIGAVACMEYITHTPELIQKSVETVKPKMLFILDNLYEKCKTITEKMGIEIVLLPLTGSMSVIPKIFVSIKNVSSKCKGVTTYKEFLCRGKEEVLAVSDAYAPCVYLSTSGTTGMPKKVVLNSYNINSVVFYYPNSGMDIKRGERFIGIAPLFISFGLTLCVHLPMIAGVTLVLCIQPDKGFDYMRKYKANHILTAPLYVPNLYEKKAKLSYLKTVAIGGESMSKEDVEYVNVFLENNNAKARLMTGYGMTELAATGITELNHIRRKGTIGIPILNANVKIVDTETNKELSYDETGEILLSSPGLMVEYLNDAEETHKVIETDNQGARWIHTGDLGKVDKDGFVSINGRLKRIYMTKPTPDTLACKLFPDYIENLLSTCTIIKECAVVVIPDKELLNVAVAFCVLKETVSNPEIFISQHLNGVANYNIPKRFCFVKEIPHLPNGKKDYKKLEKECIE